MPRKPAQTKAKTKVKAKDATQAALNFAALVDAIQQAHSHCAAAANRAVNSSLTLRNWIIGAYLHHYELYGADRAEYGNRLLNKLAERLGKQKMSRIEVRELRRYRSFYLAYPQIGVAVLPESGTALALAIRETLPPEFGLAFSAAIRETVSPEFLQGNHPQIRETLHPESAQSFSVAIRETASPELLLGNHIQPAGMPGQKLLERLSFSHFAELLAIDDPLKRIFYEIECIRGNWSVRALKRQINSLYFERSGLSLDKDKLSALAHAAAEQAEPRLSIRDPYIFEFLGLTPAEAMSEADLEQAMLSNLQDFLLELGHGFCLEARQKSIVIGQTRGFVDLVFYHRVLKCHVLVELKVDEFRHEHIGQLNTYVAWFEKNMMQEGDNPPIGLLLCTSKDHTLVEYALSSMSDRLFVSKYQLELPSKELLQRFLDEKLKEIGGEI